MTTEHEAKRQGIIKGLRELADALEATPGLPTPYDVHTDLFWQLDDNASLAGRLTQDIARAAMAALPGDWSKSSPSTGSYISYDRSFGEYVTYSLNIDRADVCRRVQVGTKTVPAHDEPVYEWECGPETDVSVALAEHTAPALEAIQQAAVPDDVYDLIDDPFAGIPNADDSLNEPM